MVGIIIAVLFSPIPIILLINKLTKTSSFLERTVCIVLTVLFCFSLYPLSKPHLLFSNYINIDKCSTTTYTLENFTSRKGTERITILDSNTPKVVTVDGGLGYWVKDERELPLLIGQSIEITQCPYLGSGYTSDMVGHIETNDVIFFQYRNLSEYSELAKVNRWVMFVLSPLMLLFMLLYSRRLTQARNS